MESSEDNGIYQFFDYGFMAHAYIGVWLDEVSLEEFRFDNPGKGYDKHKKKWDKAYREEKAFA